ncbi:MAG: LacI family DNA-binding transcriptional regulator [Actinomycetota bacterium]
MGITIYDVATGANVSPATVSRVLAGGNSVAPATAARVQEVIERLGYKPDRVAQSLRRQRSGSIGLILPMESHPCAGAIIARLSTRLSERDLSLTMVNCEQSPMGPSVDLLLAQRVDGLIIVNNRPSVEIPTSAAAEVPVIALDSGADNEAVDRVRIDHAGGVAQAVRFLVREGAERLAYIGEGATSVIGAQQLDGYASATSEFETKQVALRLGPPTAQFAWAELERLRAGDEPPDAYVCGSDTVATAINGALPPTADDDRERPFIVGYGAQPWVPLMRPTLTTVRLPIEDLVDEALRVMDQRLGGLQVDPIDIALPPHLILGDTS